MDQERIRKMTRLAMFESGEGRRDLEICRFFRRDYIGLGLLLNGVLVTVAYVIILLAVALYNMDELSAHFNEIDFQSMTFTLILGYIIFLAVFSVIVYTVRKLRYAKAKRNVDEYYDALGELSDIYRFEELTGQSRKRRRDS